MANDHYKSEYWLKKLKNGASYASLRDQIQIHSPAFRDTCLAALDVANAENKESKEIKRWLILVLITITLPFIAPYLINQHNYEKSNLENEINCGIRVENKSNQCSVLNLKK